MDNDVAHVRATKQLHGTTKLANNLKLPLVWLNTDVVIEPSLTPTWTSWVYYTFMALDMFKVDGCTL